MASRKKWKNLSPLLQGVVYLGTRLVICLFQTLSHDLARTFITILTWIAYAVDRRHRLIGLENLRQAFPGRYSEAELDAMVFATYRHFFTLLIEVTQLPRKVHRQNTGNHFDLGRDEQTILSLLKSDRPLLIVTAHFGNWELAGYGLAPGDSAPTQCPGPWTTGTSKVTCAAFASIWVKPCWRKKTWSVFSPPWLAEVSSRCWRINIQARAAKWSISLGGRPLPVKASPSWR